MGNNKDWKKVGKKEFNETINFKKDGDELIGTYKGSKDVTTSYGEQQVHTVERNDGREVDFFGSGQLNNLLAEVEIGTDVKIIYHGKKPTKIKLTTKSGKERQVTKDIHQFEVFTK